MSAPGPPFDVLAREVLLANGIDPTPPVDVYGLARAMGVDEIRLRRMPEDGILEHRPGATRIYLNADAYDSRKRFTLAHELGHLLLARPHVPLTARRLAPVMTDEERFCDSFAAALLMPVGWIRSRAGASSPSLAKARELADASGCSLSSTVVRLDKVLRWRRALMTWHRSEGGWRLVSVAAVPSALHGHLRSARETRARLEAGFGEQSARVNLPLIVGGALLTAPAELATTPRGVIGLVDLTHLA